MKFMLLQSFIRTSYLQDSTPVFIISFNDSYSDICKFPTHCNDPSDNHQTASLNSALKKLFPTPSSHPYLEDLRAVQLSMYELIICRDIYS